MTLLKLMNHVCLYVQGKICLFEKEHLLKSFYLSMLIQKYHCFILVLRNLLRN